MSEQDRALMASNGASKSTGGMNVPEIREFLKKNKVPVNSALKRAELEQLLRTFLVPEPNAVKPIKPVKPVKPIKPIKPQIMEPVNIPRPRDKKYVVVLLKIISNAKHMDKQALNYVLNIGTTRHFGMKKVRELYDQYTYIHDLSGDYTVKEIFDLMSLSADLPNDINLGSLIHGMLSDKAIVKLINSQ